MFIKDFLKRLDIATRPDHALAEALFDPELGVNVVPQLGNRLRCQRKAFSDDSGANLLRREAESLGSCEVVSNFVKSLLNGADFGGLLASCGDVIDKVHMNAIVDDDVILAVLRINLFPELDSALETLARQI